MNSITTRVWIAGASGRLGSALSHRFGGNTAYKLVTSDRDVAVEDVSVVGRFADINHPDVIINCAGLTDVQACEENPEEAYKINAIGARNLATAARRIDAKFIQISTDDVFGGDEDKAFCEFDDPHPTTMYGKSKYAGEKLVRELTDKHVIVRRGCTASARTTLLTACSIRRQRKARSICRRMRFPPRPRRKRSPALSTA